MNFGKGYKALIKMSALILAGVILYNSSPAQDVKLFKFGSYGRILIDVNQDDVSAALEVLVESFANKINTKYDLNYKFINNIYTSESKLKDDLEHDRLDCLSIPTITYLKFNDIIEPYFTGSSTDDPFREYILIVRNDSPYKNFEDCKNKRLLLPQHNYSALTEMWIVKEINENGEYPDFSRFFSEVSYVKFEAKVILDVFFGKADAGIVTLNSYETAITMNPQLKKEIDIIDKSEKLITGLFALRKSLEKPTKELFIESAMTLADDEQGKQILSLFKISQLLPVSEADFENSRKLYNEYNRIISRNR